MVDGASVAGSRNGSSTIRRDLVTGQQFSQLRGLVIAVVREVFVQLERQHTDDRPATVECYFRGNRIGTDRKARHQCLRAVAKAFVQQRETIPQRGADACAAILEDSLAGYSDAKRDVDAGHGVLRDTTLAILHAAIPAISSEISTL